MSADALLLRKLTATAMILLTRRAELLACRSRPPLVLARQNADPEDAEVVDGTLTNGVCIPVNGYGIAFVHSVCGSKNWAGSMRSGRFVELYLEQQGRSVEVNARKKILVVPSVKSG